MCVFVFFSGSRVLQPAQVCDVLKGFIMVLCYSMMSYVDYAMMYHIIRGQSVIKLYIIYNMLEVRSDNTSLQCLLLCIDSYSLIHSPTSRCPCCVVRWQTASSHHLVRTSWTLCTGQQLNPRRRRGRI